MHACMHACINILVSLYYKPILYIILDKCWLAMGLLCI